ncbi:MAG: hypothetical protein EON92_09840 [Burkholderiales bacterium]|nr:MAG: hypothetical protein EON92_09840 [Burkholderiales bacterium]
MRFHFTAITLSVLALCATHSFAQTLTLIDNGVDTTVISGGGLATGAGVTSGTPQILSGILDGATGDEASININSTSVRSQVIAGTGNYSVVQASQNSVGIGYTDAALGVRSGALAISGASYVGTFDLATGTLQNGLLTDALGNKLLGATETAGITNVGAIATDTLSTTGNATVGGNLAVTGSTTTNGIANTGSITTTSLSASGAVAAGTLNVAGATATNGITNTGNISSTTLTTTANATVGGNLAVTGTASTHGINNNGQVISGVANGMAASDAVNVGQLNTAVSNVVVPMATAQAATNAQVQNQLSDNRRVASTGTAMAMAAASIPALEQGKNFGVGVGGGTYDSRGAFAIGLAARVNQALQVKLNVGTGNGGKVGAGAGAMWSW